MALWDSVTGFFEDLGSFFSGKAFFEVSGYIWDACMGQAEDMLVQDPTKGTYATTWLSVNNVYTLVNTIAVTMMCLFFVYGFCRDCVDLHTDFTTDVLFKMFIRIMLTSNILTYIMTWMPKILTWARKITGAILGTKIFGYTFDGAEIYEDVAGANMGALVAFLTSAIFFMFTAICGFMIGMAVITRLVKIYMIAPFCGLALSTLAGGGQVAQTGYSYIRTFLGYACSILLIGFAIVISTTLINSISIDTENAIVKLMEHCFKMGSITFAVKGVEAIMQKAFNL